MNDTEGWLPIPGMDGYEAHPSGSIRSIDRAINIGGKRKHIRMSKGTIMSPCRSSSGYMTIHSPRSNRTVHVHRLIAATFLGEQPRGMMCDHIDGNTLNNAASNLRYVSPRVNSLNNHKAKGCQMNKHGKYQAKIKYNGKTICLGNYASARAAKRITEIVRSVLVQAEVTAAANEQLRRENEALEDYRKGAVEEKHKTQAERDRLAARVAELERELDGALAQSAHADRMEQQALAELAEVRERVGQLESARIAYASEFDGDVGNIHASIRKMKADAATLQSKLACLAGVIQERDGAAISLDRMAARIKELEADAHQSSGHEGRLAQDLSLARMERDAARADADALAEALRDAAHSLQYPDEKGWISGSLKRIDEVLAAYDARKSNPSYQRADQETPHGK